MKDSAQRLALDDAHGNNTPEIHRIKLAYHDESGAIQGITQGLKVKLLLF